MKKLESSHAGNLTAWFKGYNKRSEGAKKTRRRHQEIFKLGAEINKIEREQYKELMKHGVGLLSLLLDKINKPLLKDKEYSH